MSFQKFDLNAVSDDFFDVLPPAVNPILTSFENFTTDYSKLKESNVLNDMVKINKFVNKHNKPSTDPAEIEIQESIADARLRMMEEMGKQMKQIEDMFSSQFTPKSKKDQKYYNQLKTANLDFQAKVLQAVSAENLKKPSTSTTASTARGSRPAMNTGGSGPALNTGGSRPVLNTGSRMSMQNASKYASSMWDTYEPAVSSAVKKTTATGLSMIAKEVGKKAVPYVPYLKKKEEQLQEYKKTKLAANLTWNFGKIYGKITYKILKFGFFSFKFYFDTLSSMLKYLPFGNVISLIVTTILQLLTYGATIGLLTLSAKDTMFEPIVNGFLVILTTTFKWLAWYGAQLGWEVLKYFLKMLGAIIDDLTGNKFSSAYKTIVETYEFINKWVFDLWDRLMAVITYVEGLKSTVDNVSNEAFGAAVKGMDLTRDIVKQTAETTGDVFTYVGDTVNIAVPKKINEWSLWWEGVPPEEYATRAPPPPKFNKELLAKGTGFDVSDSYKNVADNSDFEFDPNAKPYIPPPKKLLDYGEIISQYGPKRGKVVSMAGVGEDDGVEVGTSRYKELLKQSQKAAAAKQGGDVDWDKEESEEKVAPVDEDTIRGSAKSPPLVVKVNATPFKGSIASEEEEPQVVEQEPAEPPQVNVPKVPKKQSLGFSYGDFIAPQSEKVVSMANVGKGESLIEQGLGQARQLKLNEDVELPIAKGNRSVVSNLYKTAVNNANNLFEADAKPFIGAIKTGSEESVPSDSEAPAPEYVESDEEEEDGKPFFDVNAKPFIGALKTGSDESVPSDSEAPAPEYVESDEEEEDGKPFFDVNAKPFIGAIKTGSEESVPSDSEAPAPEYVESDEEEQGDEEALKLSKKAAKKATDVLVGKDEGEGLIDNARNLFKQSKKAANYMLEQNDEDETFMEKTYSLANSLLKYGGKAASLAGKTISFFNPFGDDE
jgi:hypothetical protein